MFLKAKALLDEGKITKELFDVLELEFSTKVSELNAENKSLRLERDNLSKSYDDTMKVKTDLESQIAKIDERIEAAKTDGKREVVSQLEAERVEKRTLQENLGRLQEANSKLTLDTVLNSELQKYQLSSTASKVVPHFLRSNLTMSERGIPVFNGNEDFSGEIKRYFDENTDFLAPAQTGGSSGAAGGGGGAAKGNFAGDHASRLAAVQSMIDSNK